jgi:hypothetical protein
VYPQNERSGDEILVNGSSSFTSDYNLFGAPEKYRTSFCDRSLQFKWGSCGLKAYMVLFDTGDIATDEIN